VIGSQSVVTPITMTTPELDRIIALYSSADLLLLHHLPHGHRILIHVQSLVSAPLTDWVF
jgi:hypothetical protein